MQPVDIALDAALLVIRSGGTTAAAERTFSNLLKGLRREPVEVVWRLDFIAVTEAGPGAAPSLVRAVGPTGVNLARASEVADLAERVAGGEAPVGAVEAEVARIARLPSPYNRWLLVAVAAATAACFSRVAGGDWGSFAIAFVAAGAGQCLRALLQPRRVPIAYVTLICGVLSALIAGAGLREGLSQAEAPTMVASVVYVIPGLALINGFMDLTSHRFLLVGVERMMNAAFLFLVLAIAIAFALATVV
jgi:uncharacterized membrane protein YjjP (DUF1212 family)